LSILFIPAIFTEQRRFSHRSTRRRSALKAGIATAEVYFHHTAIFKFLKPRPPEISRNAARETDVKSASPSSTRTRFIFQRLTDVV
jgi:hypothetical protein